jgi:hypothetical protein
MNALPEGISRAPRRSDYEPIVKGLRPFIGDEELTLRSSLLLMRDRAMATKNSVCEASWMLLDVVESIAMANAMNDRVDIETLREMRRVCLNIVCAASSLETIFQPKLPLDEGEANAGG